MSAKGHEAVGAAYPLTDNGALYDSAQVETYLTTLFRNVDWEDGQLISLLGIGEKGTPQEGKFRERKIIPPAFLGSAHAHLKRWAEHHVAGFIVPAVLHAGAADDGDVKLDKVAALTALILDIDSGNTDKKRAYVTGVLGEPTLAIASGGLTDANTPKMHLYWLFNEPSDEVERVAAVRKSLAAKVGGDQSFGRATQVIRVPGSVHAKNGKPSLCKIMVKRDHEYSFDDLAELVEEMQPMPGIELPKPELPALTNGIMDFAPRFDTAIDALHRDIHENGEDLTRWGEFSKVAGFNIAEARAGRLAPDAAYQATYGWMLTHMHPAWPEARFNQEFQALVKVDVSRHGPFPQSIIAQAQPGPRVLRLEHFADIEPSLENNWLVRDHIATESLAMIYGASTAGKSFIALDISLRIAHGWDINGHKVTQGPVVYVGAEGQRGLRNRIAAWRKHHNAFGTAPFAFVPEAVNLLDANLELPSLFAAIDKAAEAFDGPPILLVLDTLAMTFGGGDENSGQDMGAYLTNVARFKERYQATVLIVHHRPKDPQNNTPRGHGSLLASVDSNACVERSGDDRTFTSHKVKDGEDGKSLRFSLVSVHLGTDSDGFPVTSAVVEYRAAKTEAAKLSEQTLHVLQALDLAIQRSSSDDASEAEWRRAWEELTPEKAEDARRKAFQRGRKDLLAADRVENNAGRWSTLAAATPAAGNVIAMDFTPKTAVGGAAANWS